MEIKLKQKLVSHPAPGNGLSILLHKQSKNLSKYVHQAGSKLVRIPTSWFVVYSVTTGIKHALPADHFDS